VLLVVLGQHGVVVGVGIVVWGLGASLGFPVGMSAAADDPARSAARVSVVSTIGYGAFLAGPPLLGWLGDEVGTLDALLAVACLMVPAALTVFATRAPAGVSRR
jgi:cyanate permease